MNKDELRFKPLSLSELIEEESDFFPLLSQEDEDKIEKEKTPKTLPILPHPPVITANLFFFNERFSFFFKRFL